MSTWYVDNEIAASGTGVSPAQAFKTLVEALNAVVGSGDTIYIKATATAYTGSGNLVVTSAFDSKTNLTIDRYPTDAGNSRPVFDREVSSSSRVWDFGNHTNLTIRNIYFKGKSDSSTDSNAYGVLNIAGGAINGLILEYCVIEQRYSYKAINMSSAVTNLTIRYCYFLNDNATEATGEGIITVVGQSLAGTMIFSYNLCDSYREMLYLNYHTSAMPIYIAHNTFINCGSNYRIMFLGTSIAANFYITDNILYADIADCVGINWATGSGMVIDDYNNFYGLADNYAGSGGTVHTPGVHDISIAPEWQGGANTWSDAHIALTAYYAPTNTNYPVVLGDSSGSCMGAIYIAAYMPPPVITPSSGAYMSSITVSISSAISGTTIRYTIDGTAPDVTSSLYSSPFTVPASTTIKAKSWKTGYVTSGETTETYIINPVPSIPTPVIINVPTVPGLGVLPCATSELFKRLKSHLVDDNIYDTSDAAVGITNYNVTFTGNIGDMPVTSLTVYRSYMGEEKVVATVVPDASGNYSFTDRLPHGRAYYYAKSSDGKYFSNTMHINSYYIHVWLCAYATELLSLRQQTAQVRQNAKIADGTDFDGDVITTDGYYLAKNFGQYITARKLEDMTTAEYQQLLLNVLEAYNLGPSTEALDLVCEVFTGVLPSLLWYKDAHGFPTTSVRLRVLAPPSLNYQWDETHCYLYDRHYRIPAGSGTIGAGQVNYVYVDGTTSPTTVDNQLSVLASGIMPYRYTMPWSETISSSLVRVDTDGLNTGVSGELYVVLSKFPVTFTGASGTLAPFTSGISSALLVGHTSNLDLGMAQDDIDKTMLWGDIITEYTTSYENIILGVVHAGATAITGIVSCGRPDGGGAVSRDISVHECCGELRIRGSASLPDEARVDLFNTLRDVKPAAAFFYIFFENAISGAYEYYGKI